MQREERMMENPFAKAYPNITHWIETQGWIEFGQDEESDSLVRALDEGGLVWESMNEHTTIDQALYALEKELSEK
jgi:hypothetical protein